jgi:hypothetical protein
MHGRPLATITHDDLVQLDACFRKLHGPSLRKLPRHRSMTIWEILAETKAEVKAGEEAIAKASRRRSKANDPTGTGGSCGSSPTGLRAITRSPSSTAARSSSMPSAIRVRNASATLRSRHSGAGARAVQSYPWTGFRSLTQRMRPGEMLVDDAWYFVPLIARYAGFGARKSVG